MSPALCISPSNCRSAIASSSHSHFPFSRSLRRIMTCSAMATNTESSGLVIAERSSMALTLGYAREFLQGRNRPTFDWIALEF
jgi:hypothetical protein